MTDILANINQINRRIEKACKDSGRNSSEVKLLLATKTVSADNIKIALEAGHTLIAENKVQELKEKHEALKGTPHYNHFIGHLQSNKIKDILKYDVTCLQSLDRIELAEKLDQRLKSENKKLDVLIQVNTSLEESKFGINPDHAIEFCQQIAQLDNLQIKGLMTIGLFSSDTKKVRNCFKLLKSIQLEIESLKNPNIHMQELSMGMSGDLEIAIEEGATIIRVGTAIFGKRIYPDSYYWNEKGNFS